MVRTGCVLVALLLLAPRAAGATNSSGGAGSLTTAIKAGDIEQVRKYASSAPLNSCAEGSSGVPVSLLELAVENGSMDITRQLLDAGANPNFRCSDGPGIGPLLAAIIGLQYEIAELLLARGADVAQQTEAGVTPLMYVVLRGCGLNYVTLLLKYKADPLARYNGRSVIESAAHICTRDAYDRMVAAQHSVTREEADRLYREDPGEESAIMGILQDLTATQITIGMFTTLYTFGRTAGTKFLAEAGGPAAPDTFKKGIRVTARVSRGSVISLSRSAPSRPSASHSE